MLFIARRQDLRFCRLDNGANRLCVQSAQRRICEPYATRSFVAGNCRRLPFLPAARAAIENGKLVESAQTYAFDQGALSNIHFLAIPKNSSAKAGAMVAINFLLSPEAQERKADSTIWGDPSVLSATTNNNKIKQKTTLYKSIAEPHPSWLIALELEWQKRYAK